MSNDSMWDMENMPTLSDLEYESSDDYYDSDDSDGNGKTHIYLRSKCDLCFQPTDSKQCIAILGHRSSTRPVYCTNLFPFPNSHGTTRHPGEVPLCRRKYECGHCFDSAEAVTIHFDCYRLFRQSYHGDKTLSSVWILSAWRYPWQPSPPTHHELDLEDRNIISVSPLRAEALGMPKLASLPPTILQDIRADSIESPFWHYSAIQELAEKMPSAAVGNSCKVYQLDKIEAWNRGESPVIAKKAAKSVLVRVTLDCRGIRKIERLPGWPQYRNWRSNSLAYVFIESAQAKKSQVYFKLGSARLDLEKRGFEWPRRWDTPTPPTPTNLSMFALPTSGFDLRLRTVDLRDTTGLTFFFIRGSIHGIHSHTASSPTALATYTRFPERIQSRLVWAYVPIPRNDRILGFGLRESGILVDIARATFSKPTVLIRTKLVGDLILGSKHRTTNRDCTFDGTPDLLVYSAPDPTKEAAFGAVAAAKAEPDSQPGTPFPSISPLLREGHRSPIITQVYVEGVIRIDVFTCRTTETCRGILLEYNNGAQRALGPCRVGIDPVTTYHNPTRICYRRDAWTPHGFGRCRACKVECFTEEDAHPHDEYSGWVCATLTKGFIQYCWDHMSSRMEMYEPLL